jgi:hypothetical protein
MRAREPLYDESIILDLVGVLRSEDLLKEGKLVL